jgi:hypothetical protein
MRRQIDPDRAVPMTSPPGPLVDTDTCRAGGRGTGVACTRGRRAAGLGGSRSVLRADGATKSGRRSVKIRRVQVVFRHTNFRTVSRMRTKRTPQGRSVRWRQ